MPGHKVSISTGQNELINNKLKKSLRGKGNENKRNNFNIREI